MSTSNWRHLAKRNLQICRVIICATPAESRYRKLLAELDECLSDLNIKSNEILEINGSPLCRGIMEKLEVKK